MKSLLGLILALALAGCTGSTLELGKTHSDEAESCVLVNDYLHLEIVPSAFGSVSNITYRPSGRKLLPKFDYKVQKIDLLPNVITCNNTGGRLVLWGFGIGDPEAFQLTRETLTDQEVAVTMQHTYLKDQPIKIQRTIALRPGRSAVQVRNRLINISDQPKKITPWENMLAELNQEHMDEVIMPTRANVRYLNGRGLKALKNTQIWSHNMSSVDDSIMTAPARNWIARRNARRTGVLAIRVPWSAIYPQGIFYAWRQKVPPVITMEIVFNPQVILPQSVYKLEYEYLYFDKLNNIQALTGNYGVDCSISGGELQIALATVEAVSAGWLKLQLVSASGKIISLPRQKIAAIRPGEVCNCSLTLPQLAPGIYRITGTIQNENAKETLKFELIEPQIQLKE